MAKKNYMKCQRILSIFQFQILHKNKKNVTTTQIYYNGIWGICKISPPSFPYYGDKFSQWSFFLNCFSWICPLFESLTLKRRLVKTKNQKIPTVFPYLCSPLSTLLSFCITGENWVQKSKIVTKNRKKSFKDKINIF